MAARKQFDKDSVSAEIARCRKEFLENGADPRTMQFIRPVIAESWIRSRDAGVDPYAEPSPPVYTAEELHEICEDNRLLMDAAIPMLRELEEVSLNTEYSFGLYSPDGILLSLRGSQSVLTDTQRHNFGPGIVSNENSVGTCAHGIAIRLKQAVTVRGAEHFNVHYISTSCSAAPIMDGTELVGVITMESISTELQYMKTLEWLKVIAWSIQSKMDSIKRRNLLLADNALKNRILDTIPESIISIDANGAVNYVNQSTSRLFDREASRTVGVPFEHILGYNPEISKAVKAKYTTRYLDVRPANSDLQLLAKVIPSEYKPAHSDEAVIQTFSQDEIALTVNLFTNVDYENTLEQFLIGNRAVRQSLARICESSKARNHFLIIGERSTGRSFLASIIHHETMPQEPLVAFECNPMNAQKTERELFGGLSSVSFNGNDLSRLGGTKLSKYELARHGTLLIENIDSMPLNLQKRLYEVIQATEDKDGTPRIIATASPGINKLTKHKLFIEGLYKKLAISTVTVPPLRARKEDIPLLSNRFLRSFLGVEEPPNFSEKAIEILENYPWPGNIAELADSLRYALEKTNGIIDTACLPPAILTSQQGADTVFSDVITISEMEQKMIEQLADRTSDTQAIANALGISRATLYRKLKKYEIQLTEQ